MNDKNNNNKQDPVYNLIDRLGRWDEREYSLEILQEADTGRHVSLSRLDRFADSCNRYRYRIMRTASPIIETAYTAVRTVILAVICSPIILLVVIGIILDVIWGYPYGKKNSQYR
jgi:hypothetical protein